jgi:hypothetical protein
MNINEIYNEIIRHIIFEVPVRFTENAYPCWLMWDKSINAHAPTYHVLGEI